MLDNQPKKTVTMKLIAGSNLEALEMIQDLWPDHKISDMRIDNDFQITNEKVYTIQIRHDNKKA